MGCCESSEEARVPFKQDYEPVDGTPRGSKVLNNNFTISAAYQNLHLRKGFFFFFLFCEQYTQQN